MGGVSKPEPVRGAERRRVARVRLRNRVRGSVPGKLTNFLPFFFQLPLLFAIGAAIPVAIVWEAIDLYQRESFAHAKVVRVDAAIARDRQATGSAYCRAIFGDGPFYRPCADGEHQGLVQFSRAWSAGKTLPTIRDHLQVCFEDAQKQQGTSWHVASVCAGADQPSPDDSYSEDKPR